MWPNSGIHKLFNVDVPIIQAPMASSVGNDMVVAVCEAGGLGSVAAAAMSSDDLRKNLSEVRKRTQKPFNVNFFAHKQPKESRSGDDIWLDHVSDYFRELGLEKPKSLSEGVITPFDDAKCKVIEEMPPCVVSFHFGLPEQALIKRTKAAGSLVLSSATTVEEARWLQDHGCDAVIAQGLEAGGHRGMFLSEDVSGQLGTMALIPQIVDAVDVPVIAAGGIADGRAIAACLTLGASAAQIGTAYLFCQESTISDVYRDAITNASSSDTCLTNVFSGRPTRTLVNRMVTEQGPMAKGAPSFPRGFSISGVLRNQAEKLGNRDFSAHYCGQSVAMGAATDARQLTQTLAKETMECLKQFRA